MFNVSQAEIYFNHNNTPVSAQFDDVYFSNQDGLAESAYVFQQGNQLWERWCHFPHAHFTIAETGFGTGLNFLSVTTLFRQFRTQFPQLPLKRLFFISFEKYPLPVEVLHQAHQIYPQFGELSQQLQAHWQDFIVGCYPFHFAETRLDLWLGDIADNLPQLGDYMQNKIDAWFLDGFAPSKNPQMWQPNLLKLIFCYTKPQGTFATFTAASAVRKNLEFAGFEVHKRAGFAKKRECLHGIKPQTDEAPANMPWYLPQPAKLTHENADIAIIGGGIASLFTALSLLQRGANVTLYCEDEAPALNASGNKQGAFYPQLSDDDHRNIRFYIHAFAYGLQQLHWLIAQQIEFEHEFCGVGLCAYDEKSAKKLAKIADYAWSAQLYQPLNATQLSEKIGLPLPCGGGFIKQGAWLAPRQLVQNTFAYLQKCGLKIKTLQKITALERQSQWVLTNAQGEKMAHDVVVLANGHQITDFAQTEKLALYPVRGQVSQIPTSPHLLKLKSVLCYDGYLTPVDQAKQSHCIGASHVRDNAERTFSAQEQWENQQKIQHNLASVDWVNDVNTSGNQARIGVRCATRDRIPMLGNVSDFVQQRQQYHNLFNLRRRKQPIENAAYFPNLYLIAALGSRGLTSAPLLGEILASLIYAEPLPLREDILQQLSPNRNWVRKWLKGSIVE